MPSHNKGSGVLLRHHAAEWGSKGYRNSKHKPASAEPVVFVGQCGPKLHPCVLGDCGASIEPNASDWLLLVDAGDGRNRDVVLQSEWLADRSDVGGHYWDGFAGVSIVEISAAEHGLCCPDASNTKSDNEHEDSHLIHCRTERAPPFRGWIAQTVRRGHCLQASSEI